jgi:Fur family transcriptional regulator, ferric uptake regulator
MIEYFLTTLLSRQLTDFSRGNIMERNTRQRDAIRQVFAETDRPLSPQEILLAAQAHIPALGIATVYRTLKALIEEDWLAPVELPGEPQRYEIAGKGHHHHFRCHACDRVYEIDGCLSNLKRLVPHGFQIDRHEVVLYGTCNTCSA